jgi:hypothetical protein
MLVFLFCYCVRMFSVSVTTSYKSTFDFIFLDSRSELPVFRCIAWLTIGEYSMTTAADGEYTPRPTVTLIVELFVHLHRFAFI